MINAYEIQKLTEAEAEQATKAEVLVDAQITAEFEKNPTQRFFEINRKKLNAAVGGMSVKVREDLLSRYASNGWKQETKGENYVLTMKSRRGRKKGSKVEKTETPEKVETPEPAVT